MGLSHLTSAGITDTGAKRKNNEDSIVLLPEYGVYCVADGMGGAQGGEVASDAVVTQLADSFHALKSPTALSSVTGRGRLVVKSLNRASQWIKQRSDKMGLSGSGSTAVVMAFDERNPAKAMVLHAGDSRAYRLRNQQIEQISQDHTVAAAAGVTDDSELPPMFRGVVTRAVGVKAKVEVEKTLVDVLPGDIYLLASDGLDKMVTDERIRQLTYAKPTSELQEIAQTLIDEANSNGGVDNVSVVLVVVGVQGEDADPALARYSKADEDAEAAIIGTMEATLPDADATPTPTNSDEGGALADYTPDSDTLEGATPSRDSAAPTGERIGGPPRGRGSWWQRILGWPMAAKVGVPVALVVLGLLANRGDNEAEPDAMLEYEISPNGANQGAGAETAKESEHEAGDRILAMLNNGQTEEGELKLDAATQRERMIEEKVKAEKIAQQEVNRARLAKAKAEKERLAAEKAKAEQVVAEKAEAERMAAAKAEEEQRLAEQVEQEKLAKAKAEEERLAAENAKAEQVAAEKAEAERMAASKAEQTSKILQEPEGFSAKLDDVMQSGGWGDFADKVAVWEQTSPNLVERSGRQATFTGWVEAWKEARKTASILPQQSQEWMEAVYTMAGRTGIGAPPSVDVSWEGDGASLASTYCAEQYRLQTWFIGSMREFLDAHQAQAAALGDEPEDTLLNLWNFAGLSNKDAVMKLTGDAKQSCSDLQPLQDWVARWGGQPMLVTDLNDVPVESMETIAKSADTVWKEIYGMVEFIAPQVSVWRNWEDERIAPYLDEIAELQQDVILGKRRFPDDFSAWRLSEDHVALEELLMKISEVYPLLKTKTKAAAL